MMSPVTWRGLSNTQKVLKTYIFCKEKNTFYHINQQLTKKVQRFTLVSQTPGLSSELGSGFGIDSILRIK